VRKSLVLIFSAIAAALLYSGASLLYSGTIHIGHAIVVGTIVALVVAGIRRRTGWGRSMYSSAPTTPAAITPSKKPKPPEKPLSPREAEAPSATTQSTVPTSSLPPPSAAPSALPASVETASQPGSQDVPTAAPIIIRQEDELSAEELWALAVQKDEEMQRDLAEMAAFSEADGEMHPRQLEPGRIDEYMHLVHAAAEMGVIDAIIKLGTFAYEHQMFVEAYFWLTIAYRKMELAGDVPPEDMSQLKLYLREVRYAWRRARGPMQFENVHDAFPPERGELGRAFLRLDCGLQVGPTRDFIRRLAADGNPDAALFV